MRANSNNLHKKLSPMNIKHIATISAVSAAILAAAIVIPSGQLEAREPAAATPQPQAGFSTVVNPVIPYTVCFAGKDISLENSDMAERFDREITAMAYTHGNTLLTIKRANRYFPRLAPILKKHGVPEDLLYLAAIESYLNPMAVSPAKAAGMWQFIPSTAKEYGLEVNEYVDERFDIEKETEAACRYLKNALAKYGNWETVAASYNGGMARVTKELAAQQAASAYDLWLAEETMRYPFRLLAMKTIMENPSDYGYRITPEALYQPVEYKTVKVNAPVADWPQWAKDHGTDYRTLREHNPWIRSKELPNRTGKTYTVRIPEEKSLSRTSRKTHVYDHRWVAAD